MKKVNEKNDDFLMKICGFWIDFEADFKPSILKQDKLPATMVRFADENTAIVNNTPYQNGLEQRISKKLKEHRINTIPFPYFDSPKNSAVGCYINFLETEQAIFLPVFGVDMDSKDIDTAQNIFNKTIVPVNINEIAEQSGVLNCIS